MSLALYVYFIAALLGRQFVPYADPNIYKSGTKWEVPDMYFPFFTSLQVNYGFFCFHKLYNIIIFQVNSCYVTLLFVIISKFEYKCTALQTLSHSGRMVYCYGRIIAYFFWGVFSSVCGLCGMWRGKRK